VLDVASFSGFRVYRVLPASEADLEQLASMQESPFYDFWTEVTMYTVPKAMDDFIVNNEM
jgi:hypothetical protein